MEVINNLHQVKSLWTPLKAWERRKDEEESCFDKLKDKMNLSAEEISYSQKKGKVITDAVKTMDQLSINKSENAMITLKTALGLGTNIFALIGLAGGYILSKTGKSVSKTPKMAAVVGFSIFGLIASTVSQFISAHFEKKATRIARYQARNNEMKDFRNFVVYDDEQIAKARQLASTMGDVKDVTDDMSMRESINPKNVFKKSFEAIESLNKDYAKYENWHKNYLEQEKIKKENQKSISLTKEEQIEAEKSKNVTLRTIRKLEIGSNNYEINFGFAVKTAAVLASLASVAGGFLGFWAFGKMAGRAGSNKVLSKAADVLSKLSIPAGIASLFLFVGPLAKLSKDSAKIGRYKETERLFSHNRNFVPFTDEQINEIRSKKGHRHHHHPHSVSEIIAKDIKDMTKIKSDFAKYNEYKNTVLKEDLKLKEALKSIPITAKQEKDAKKLQKEIFMAFEKIDDKTESFVDDTAAFTDSCTKVITGAACTIANLLTLKFFGNKISQFTKNKTMPGFFEGLKLTKNLSLKNIGLIFILPFAVTRLIIFLTSLGASEVQKKACRIGMMAAMEELDNPKNFAEPKADKKQIESSSIFEAFTNKKAP